MKILFEVHTLDQSIVNFLEMRMHNEALRSLTRCLSRTHVKLALVLEWWSLVKADFEVVCPGYGSVRSVGFYVTRVGLLIEIVDLADRRTSVDHDGCSETRGKRMEVKEEVNL